MDISQARIQGRKDCERVRSQSFLLKNTFSIKRSLDDLLILKVCSAACGFDQEVQVLPRHLHNRSLSTLQAY
jgi:hypothetical protein